MFTRRSKAHPVDLPPGARRWIVDRDEWPWFEKPDAHAQVPEIAARWPGDSRLEAWLEQWVQDGYFVAENFVPVDLVDEIGGAIDDIWKAEEPIPGLAISDLRIDDDGVVIHCPHERLAAVPLSERAAIERRSFWRIGAFNEFDARAQRLYAFKGIQQVASAIFDRPAVPQFSLTFGKGSRQQMHQDTYVFHVWPMHYICGVWIACEDIHPDSGPLVFYPGSHREPLYAPFDNYPQTQCRTASSEENLRYLDHLHETMARYPRKEFIARKGDALFWHGMLIHGGAPVRDDNLSRLSFVIHLLPPGASRGHEVVGPFNW